MQGPLKVGPPEHVYQNRGAFLLGWDLGNRLVHIMTVTPSKGQSYLATNKGTGDSPTPTTDTRTVFNLMPPTPSGSSKQSSFFLPFIPLLHAASQDHLFPTYVDCDTDFWSHPSLPASCKHSSRRKVLLSCSMAHQTPSHLEDERALSAFSNLLAHLWWSLYETGSQGFLSIPPNIDSLRTNDQMTKSAKGLMAKANLLTYLLNGTLKWLTWVNKKRPGTWDGGKYWDNKRRLCPGNHNILYVDLVNCVSNWSKNLGIPGLHHCPLDLLPRSCGAPHSSGVVH